MLTGPVSDALTVALAAVVVWCCYALVRRPRVPTADAVPADVEAGHGVMGVAMLLSLRWVLSSEWAWLGCGVFAAMALWCTVRGSSRGRSGHYGRLGFTAFAMVAMLVPAGAANAASADATGMHDTSGSMLAGPAALALALAMLAVAALATRLAARVHGRRSRLSAACEAVMAATMAAMALAMV